MCVRVWLNNNNVYGLCTSHSSRNLTPKLTQTWLGKRYQQTNLPTYLVVKSQITFYTSEKPLALEISHQTYLLGHGCRCWQRPTTYLPTFERCHHSGAICVKTFLLQLTIYLERIHFSCQGANAMIDSIKISHQHFAVKVWQQKLFLTVDLPWIMLGALVTFVQLQ